MKIKNLILFCLFFLFSSLITAQQNTGYRVLQSRPDFLSLEFVPEKIFSEEKKTTDGFYSSITMEGYHLSSDPGKPALPTIVKLFELPLCDSLQIAIYPGEYDIVDAALLGFTHPLMPVQPSYPKSYEGDIPFVKDELIYAMDDFYFSPLVKVERNGVLRDMNLGTVYCSPVQYNPVTHQFKIYRSVQVEITFRNADLPATLEMKRLHGNGVFSGVKNQIINPILVSTRDIITTAPIKYLIVSHPMFEEQLSEFIRWKKRKGFIVEVAYTDDPSVGTTTSSIKSYIKSHYTNATPENPAPTYVLLVGDVEQIPAFQKSEHVTDLDYFTWTDGDALPDCYYGRFSAQNISQLLPQLEKTLLYEQYRMPNPDYLDDAIMIAGNDNYFAPTHGNGQVNYLTGNYFTAANGYANIHKYLHNCESQAATIRSVIYSGVGYANFTAHCSSAGWSRPDFLTSHVSLMNNAGKYGLMIGNCCESSAFNESECFAEAVLRAPEKGAVAYIGASNSSYWDEDYYWSIGVRSSLIANPTYDAQKLGVYDRLFHSNGEPYSDWHTTNGAIITAGNLSVQSSTSGIKQYYWEIYHLMGDPSLMTYLAKPSVMEVTSPAAIQVGSTSFSVHAVPYAYVALTYNNQVIIADFANEDGDVTLSFDTLRSPGNYELAVSAQNYVHHFRPLTVIPTEGSYVMAQEVSLSESVMPELGAELTFNMNIKNFGTEQADDVYVKVLSASDKITFLEDSVFVGDLNSGQSFDITAAFHAELAPHFEDQTLISVSVLVYGGDQMQQRDFSFKAIAPKLVRDSYLIEEHIGNNNGIIEQGETVKITFKDMNAGHLKAFYTTSALISHYSKATVESPMYLHYDVPEQTAMQATFYVKLANDIPPGTIIPLYYRIRSGGYIIDDTIALKLQGEMEDFETNSFTKYDWNNSPSYPWIITSASPYSGSYCAKSANNLPNNSASALEITVNVPYNDEISFYRKVSSERNYDFFKFYIDGDIMEAQAGSVSWGKVSFPVNKGVHTFKFEYSKDISGISGSDCAWIDNIVLPGVGIIAPADSIVDFPSKIDDIENDRQVLLYPNPASNQILIKAEGFVTRASVIDLSGRELLRVEQLQNTSSVDISSFAKGFYLLKIEFDDSTSVIRKFVKQ